MVFSSVPSKGSSEMWSVEAKGTCPGAVIRDYMNVPLVVVSVSGQGPLTFRHAHKIPPLASKCRPDTHSSCEGAPEGSALQQD